MRQPMERGIFINVRLIVYVSSRVANAIGNVCLAGPKGTTDNEGKATSSTYF